MRVVVKKKSDFNQVKVDFTKRSKSLTIPNQALTLGQILDRFTRNIPVDIVRRDPVYHDQNEFDLEKMSRMDFADQQEFADQMARRAQDQENELIERKRKEDDRRMKEDVDAAAKKVQTGPNPGEGKETSPNPA
jgi:hypothetical protein